ncbi:VOC family protein [Staphylococcus ratti]|uniref:VOC family protein n=1 Tax=Staphylococcus ratti TaxID=2892440 RepID=A0ABY3PBJ5_9STAP|nr:VOC family protein [Staphylococcus ratti]UEX89670.1 VOC family protein [Staphylococcus ratti]
MNFHDNRAIHVNRITLNVANLEKQTHFYQAIVGLPIKSQSKQQVVFSIGTKGHELVLNDLKEGRQATPYEAGLFHIAFLLDSVNQLGALIKHLSSFNIPIGGGDHLVSQAIYFTDTEGNGIEVYVDRDARTWEWQNQMVKMDTLPLDIESIIGEAESTIWEGMHKNAQIGHLHLKASDLKEGRLFYERIGFNVASTLPQAFFMSDKQYHHHLALNTWQSHQKRKSPLETYGLSTFNVVIPNGKVDEHVTPEGLILTINK